MAPSRSKKWRPEIKHDMRTCHDAGNCFIIAILLIRTTITTITITLISMKRLRVLGCMD